MTKERLFLLIVLAIVSTAVFAADTSSLAELDVESEGRVWKSLFGRYADDAKSVSDLTQTISFFKDVVYLVALTSLIFIKRIWRACKWLFFLLAGLFVASFALRPLKKLLSGKTSSLGPYIPVPRRGLEAIRDLEPGHVYLCFGESAAGKRTMLAEETKKSSNCVIVPESGWLDEEKKVKEELLVRSLVSPFPFFSFRKKRLLVVLVSETKNVDKYEEILSAVLKVHSRLSLKVRPYISLVVQFSGTDYPIADLANDGKIKDFIFIDTLNTDECAAFAKRYLADENVPPPEELYVNSFGYPERLKSYLDGKTMELKGDYGLHYLKAQAKKVLGIDCKNDDLRLGFAAGLYILAASSGKVDLNLLSEAVVGIGSKLDSGQPRARLLKAFRLLFGNPDSYVVEPEFIFAEIPLIRSALVLSGGEAEVTSDYNYSDKLIEAVESYVILSEKHKRECGFLDRKFLSKLFEKGVGDWQRTFDLAIVASRLFSRLGPKDERALSVIEYLFENEWITRHGIVEAEELGSELKRFLAVLKDYDYPVFPEAARLVLPILSNCEDRMPLGSYSRELIDDYFSALESEGSEKEREYVRLFYELLRLEEETEYDAGHLCEEEYRKLTNERHEKILSFLRLIEDPEIDESPLQATTLAFFYQMCSYAFLDEHADIYDEIIRCLGTMKLRAAWETLRQSTVYLLMWYKAVSAKTTCRTLAQVESTLDEVLKKIDISGSKCLSGDPHTLANVIWFVSCKIKEVINLSDSAAEVKRLFNRIFDAMRLTGAKLSMRNRFKLLDQFFKLLGFGSITEEMYAWMAKEALSLMKWADTIERYSERDHILWTMSDFVRALPPVSDEVSKLREEAFDFFLAAANDNVSPDYLYEMAEIRILRGESYVAVIDDFLKDFDGPKVKSLVELMGLNCALGLWHGRVCELVKFCNETLKKERTVSVDRLALELAKEILDFLETVNPAELSWYYVLEADSIILLLINTLIPRDNELICNVLNKHVHAEESFDPIINAKISCLLMDASAHPACPKIMGKLGREMTDMLVSKTMEMVESLPSIETQAEKCRVLNLINDIFASSRHVVQNIDILSMREGLVACKDGLVDGLVDELDKMLTSVDNASDLYAALEESQLETTDAIREGKDSGGRVLVRMRARKVIDIELLKKDIGAEEMARAVLEVVNELNRRMSLALIANTKDVMKRIGVPEDQIRYGLPALITSGVPYRLIKEAL